MAKESNRFKQFSRGERAALVHIFRIAQMTIEEDFIPEEMLPKELQEALRRHIRQHHKELGVLSMDSGTI